MITVLGATGFIGHRLVQALRAAGNEVYAPTRQDAQVFSRPLGDLYYCIGKTANYADDAFATFEAHCAYLLRLLQLADFERIVYLSSTRVYDGLTVGKEDAQLHLSPGNPRHLYDVTKALGEHFVSLHSKGRGMVARLSCVYAAEHDATGFLPELLRGMHTQRSIVLQSSPLAARDYVHVDDVVAGLQLMMTKGQPGHTYNVASGENIANAHIGKLLADAGWSIRFTDLHSQPVAAPVIDIGKLTSLGWQPKTLEQFIKQYLHDQDI